MWQQDLVVIIWLTLLIVYGANFLSHAATIEDPVTEPLRERGIFPFVTTSTPSPTCTCGQKKDGTRIVGGSPAEINEYPWMVVLQRILGPRRFCAGALITNLHILTAAHCLLGDTGNTAETIEVVLQDHDLTITTESASFTRTVSRILNHPDYNPTTFLNDISIVTMSSPVTITRQVLPVCLPEDTSTLYANRDAVVAGWGNIAFAGFASDILLEVTVPVLTNAECVMVNIITSGEDQKLCAGSEGMDACQGDSGAPLVVVTPERLYEAIGVVSFGVSCGVANQPGVYTRVTSYLGWIQDNTQDGVYCEGFNFPSRFFG